MTAAQRISLDPIAEPLAAPRIDRFWEPSTRGSGRRSGQYDVVVCYGWRAASSWIALWRPKCQVPSSSSARRRLCCRDAEVRGWKVLVKRNLIPRILHLADRAFVPSSRAARFLREMGLKDDRIFFTPYVVDSDFFQQTAKRVDRTARRMRKGVPSGVVVALFVGMLVAWKRPLDLLEAASRVEGIHLVVAGDSELRSSVWRRANEAAGDLVKDGETGYVMSVGDVEALADHLLLMAGNPDVRQSLGEAAHRRIASWTREQNAHPFAAACVELTRPAQQVTIR